MNEIRRVVPRERRRRGRPKLPRNERRARALLLYTSMHCYFEGVSLGTRLFPRTMAEDRLHEALRNLDDDHAFVVFQSMGLPRIVELARKGRPADLALEYTARYLRLSPDATEHLIREARIVFPHLEELFRRVAPGPRRVAYLRRLRRSLAANVRRSRRLSDHARNVERNDEQVKNAGADELRELMRQYPLTWATQELKWHVSLRYDRLFTDRSVTAHWGEAPAAKNFRHALEQSISRGDEKSAIDRVLLFFLMGLGTEMFGRRYGVLAQSLMVGSTIAGVEGERAAKTLGRVQVLLGLAVVRELTDPELQARFCDFIGGIIGWSPPKEWFSSGRQ